jgi:hypothetical protein
MKKTLTILTMFMLLFSCGKENSSSYTTAYTTAYTTDAYTMMETAFEGYPRKSEIQPMMQKVMKMYGYPETEENLQRFGSVLVSLRKESVLGVTEMDILKHVYQNGNTSITFPQQAAISAVYLEKYKK